MHCKICHSRWQGILKSTLPVSRDDSTGLHKTEVAKQKGSAPRQQPVVRRGIDEQHLVRGQLRAFPQPAPPTVRKQTHQLIVIKRLVLAQVNISEAARGVTLHAPCTVGR